MSNTTTTTQKWNNPLVLIFSQATLGKIKIMLSMLITLFALNAKAQWVTAGNGMDFYVHGSAVHDGYLYACGNFEHADGNECLGIAKWDGSAWSDVGGGFQHYAFSNVVYGMTVFNNELVAGGYVDSAGGVPIHKVATWNGTAWSPLGMDIPISTVRCFTVHNGELYAGGNSSGLGNHAVAKWNGTNWTALDEGSGTVEVWALASYNGELYAGGSFDNLDGVSVGKIARWNGTAWSDVGGGFTSGFTDQVRAMAVFNGKLYVGGYFTAAGSVTLASLASWDGSTWADIGGGVNAAVQSLLPYGDKIFVGGTYWEVGGLTANRAAYWDGSSWTVLGLDLAAGARSQAVYNNELYSFGEGAGQAYAAKWSGETFTGISELQTIHSINIFPNPASGEVQLTFNNQQSGAGNNYEVSIYNLLGQEVLREKLKTHAGGNSVSLKIGGLSAGTYFVKVNGDEELKAIKLIKE